MESSYTHSRRWEKAQDIEKIFWRREPFRDSEFKEIVVKYAERFVSIEKRYNFGKDTKMLDLGCGATCPSTLFKAGTKYGVDPIVDCYLEKHKRDLAGKILLSAGTGENIPFEDNCFDVVVCRNALDHMDNIGKVMDEIKRVAKPGGLLILAVYTYTPFIAFLKKASEFIIFVRNVEHPHTFTPDQFKGLCEKYFTVLEDSVVFEGKNSIDYGKQDVELNEPLIHKIFAWINMHIMGNKWFLRELMVIARKE